MCHERTQGDIQNITRTDSSSSSLHTNCWNPNKSTPRRIPAHFKDEVLRQLQVMLDQGIIEESNSPWMAPIVFVRKKTGDVRLCVDYRELNKITRDAYPLPLPDEVQDRLANSAVFSTLDLQSGYWQLPASIEDREKTAFCQGPGMGLYQFCRMPFGLAGAPASFQRLMDKSLKTYPLCPLILMMYRYSPQILSCTTNTCVRSFSSSN